MTVVLGVKCPEYAVSVVMQDILFPGVSMYNESHFEVIVVSEYNLL